MNEALLKFLLNIGVILFIYFVARVWMYFYFKREDNKMLDRAMLQIDMIKQRHQREMERYYNK